MNFALPARMKAAIERTNAFQDLLIERYFVPYSITAVYWSFAFVFIYLGLMKVAPHRSTADIPLATIAALVGLPYIPFVTAVGVWQLVIGVLFLVRKLRWCAWFFFAYQFFTFGTLIALWRIVFQPPWIDVFGVEIPWALGSYSAFILKNLIFASVFFVLATYEIGGSGGSGSLIQAAYRRAIAPPLSRVGAAVPRLGRTIARLRALPINTWQDYLVSTYFVPYGITAVYLSYAFIWFYFGFQKPAPVISPVRTPLSDFFPHFFIPLIPGMLFIGFYEMTLGILLFARELRVAFWLFLPHQAITVLSLLVIPFTAFQPPYLELLGLQIPWALTGYGAFVVKNVVFIGGFMLLVSHELGSSGPDREPEPTPTAAESADRSAPAGGR